MWEVLNPDSGITEEMRDQCIPPDVDIPQVILDYDKKLRAKKENEKKKQVGFETFWGILEAP